MFSTRLIATSVALLLATTGTGGTNQDTTERLVMAFAGVGEIDGNSVAIRGQVGPANFFENLRSIDSKNGTVFRNSDGEVRFFPDRITVTLFIIGPFTKRARDSGPDAQYMEGIKFKAEWKRGVERRPVQAFRQLKVSVTEPPDAFLSRVIKECWVYEFVIEDSEVPISDHLILDVTSPENKRLARLSAHL